MNEYKTGTFCWVDLATIGAEDAKKFYAGLFGWGMEDNPAGEGMVYTMLNLDDKPIGGLYEMGPQQKEQNMPPNWTSYIAVDNADDILARAAELGGTVLMPAGDVMDAGRMGLIQDPTGAVFAVWQPKQHTGAAIRNVPGAMCWNELATSDTEKAEKFYTALFGWTAKTDQMGHMTYTTFSLDDKMVAGMYKLLPEMEGIPPHWLPYFQLGDIEATVEKAKSMGGKMPIPVQFVEGVGHFTVLQDPQGAAFGVVQ